MLTCSAITIDRLTAEYTSRKFVEILWGNQCSMSRTITVGNQRNY